MSEETISEKKLEELLNDKEMIKLITKNWLMHQEMRLLHRKIDKLDAMVKENQQEIMNKYKLNWQQTINLFILEDVLLSKKVPLESNDLEEIVNKMVEKYHIH